MAQLTLSDADLQEVRLLVGSRVSTDLLTNEDIRSETVLGTATDYVYERVREGLDVSLLDATQADAAERLYDRTPDDVDNFVSIVLRPPQPTQFKRAVIYYCAGLCLPLVQQVRQETKGSIQQAIDIQSWEDKQANYFEQSNREIARLRNVFPDDAFPQQGGVKYNLFGVTR